MNFSVFPDPIDCFTDPCHLAWIVNENRQHLNHVQYATCSNGTALNDLNSIEFITCHALSSYVNTQETVVTNLASRLPVNYLWMYFLWLLVKFSNY